MKNIWFTALLISSTITMVFSQNNPQKKVPTKSSLIFQFSSGFTKGRAYNTQGPLTPVGQLGNTFDANVLYAHPVSHSTHITIGGGLSFIPFSIFNEETMLAKMAYYLPNFSYSPSIQPHIGLQKTISINGKVSFLPGLAYTPRITLPLPMNVGYSSGDNNNTFSYNGRFNPFDFSSFRISADFAIKTKNENDFTFGVFSQLGFSPTYNIDYNILYNNQLSSGKFSDNASMIGVNMGYRMNSKPKVFLSNDDAFVETKNYNGNSWSLYTGLSENIWFSKSKAYKIAGSTNLSAHLTYTKNRENHFKTYGLSVYSIGVPSPKSKQNNYQNGQTNLTGAFTFNYGLGKSVYHNSRHIFDIQAGIMLGILSQNKGDAFNVEEMISENGIYQPIYREAAKIDTRIISGAFAEISKSAQLTKNLDLLFGLRVHQSFYPFATNHISEYTNSGEKIQSANYRFSGTSITPFVGIKLKL